MKKALLSIFIIALSLQPPLTHASETDDLAKKVSYYQIRHEIACREYDTTDARCFWNKVELVHAKEVVGREDIEEYLTDKELERISKKIGFLESRYVNFCEEAEEPLKFCSALGKLVEKGNYFLENEQQYLPDEEEIDTSLYDCSSNSYNCSDFSTQSEAQSAHDYCFAQVGSDIHRLDMDGNGDACEGLD